jgi:hypothetical protein
MRIILDSSADEYARQFWDRQRAKQVPADRDALADIAAGGDPVAWLRSKYLYKLPRADSDVFRVALLDREDVEALLVHDYMPCDRWMRDRGMVPDPYTRRLSDLAGMFISRGYFRGRWGDRQLERYRAWTAAGSLKDAIAGRERTLVECVRPGEYEIVDGWGRLLPFAALLRQGYEFHPAESFVAWRKCDAP